MEIFNKRYFIWISFSFLTFSAFSLLLEFKWLSIIFCALSAVFISLLFLIKNKPENFTLIIVLILLFSLLGSARSLICVWEEENVKNKYCGERYICGYVSEVSRSAVYSSEYVVFVESADGERTSFSAILLTDFDAGLAAGDFFEAEVEIVDFDKYTEENFISNSYSSDYAMVCVARQDSEIIFAETEFRIQLVLKNLNKEISHILTSSIKGTSGKMASALLLGNRNLLADDVLRDFRRAGAYHMLALSGMHVSVIVGIFEFLLKKLYVPKGIRIAILSALLIFYVALTGFLPSACRAMLMLWIYYLAVCLGKRSDPLTALFAAVSLIVLISPESVLDLGLLLSFLSTFGIIIASLMRNKIKFFTREAKGGKLCKKAVSFFKNIIFMLLATLCVFVATLPILQMFFGEVSLATFFTNLFVGIFAEVLLALAIGIAVFSYLGLPVGILSALAEITGGLMTNIISKISDLKNIVLSLEYPFAFVLVWTLFLSSLVLLTVKLKRKIVLAIPPVIFGILMSASITYYNISREDTVLCEFVSTENGDSLALSSNGGFYICDMSEGSYSEFYEVLQLAKENCFSEISGVILTHYHSSHSRSLQKLCLRQTVRAVYLPMPQSEDEYYICRGIFAALDGGRTDIILYDREMPLDVLEGELFVSDAVYADGKAHPSFALSYEYGESRLTVIENPFFGTYLESNEALKAFVSESDLLIFGGHGDLPEQKFEIADNVANVGEICFAEKEAVLLSDLDVERKDIYIDVKYKKYILD